MPTKYPDRISRVTYPTASFSLTAAHLAWIAKEAKRRAIPKSVLIRELIDRAMGEEKERAA